MSNGDGTVVYPWSLSLALGMIRFVLHVTVMGILAPFLGGLGWLLYRLAASQPPLSMETLSLGGAVFLATAGVALCWWILIPFGVMSYCAHKGVSEIAIRRRPLWLLLLSCGSLACLGLIMGATVDAGRWLVELLVAGLLVGLLVCPIVSLIWAFPPPRRCYHRG